MCVRANQNEDDPELYYLTGMCAAADSAIEQKGMFQLALSKIDKAERAGQTDLEHLKRVVHEQLARLPR